jgi:hypothetical protein
MVPFVFSLFDESSLRTAEGGEAITVMGDCFGLRPRNDIDRHFAWPMTIRAAFLVIRHCEQSQAAKQSMSWEIASGFALAMTLIAILRGLQRYEQLIG